MIYTVIAFSSELSNKEFALDSDLRKCMFKKDLMLFHNEDEAYVEIRRFIRDAYLNDEISYDAIKEMVFVPVAEFDSNTGKFDNFYNWINWPGIGFIKDLTGDDNEDIPYVGDENA